MEKVDQKPYENAEDSLVHITIIRSLLCMFLCALTAFLMGTKAYSAQISDEQIKNVTLREMKKSLANDGYSRLDIEVLHLPFKYMYVPDGKISYRLSSNSNRIASRSYQKLEVCVNDMPVKIIGVPVSLKAYKRILVARNSIKRDCTISPALVEIKEEDVSGMVANPVLATELPKNLISTKYFFAGEVIDKKFVKEKPDVQVNSPVSIVFKDGNGIAITIEGTSMKEGYVGDIISVQNRSLRKVYTGKIIEENKVLVKI